MGLSSISSASLLLILLIVVLLFGSKRLRNLGEDISVAIRGLRQGTKESGNSSDQATEQSTHDQKNKD